MNYEESWNPFIDELGIYVQEQFRAVANMRDMGEHCEGKLRSNVNKLTFYIG